MHQIGPVTTGVTHQLYRAALDAASRPRATAAPDPSSGERDRGAVSLEQVLWFVAAGVSVAVIAAILWNRIRSEAEQPIETPDPLG